MQGLSEAFEPWRGRFEELAARSNDLTEELRAWDEALEELAVSGVYGLEAVEGILRFMESHPELDYGMPGSLVHYVERFFRQGYETRLLESIRRQPTPHTIWMLNRVLSGTTDPPAREILTEALSSAQMRLR